MWLKGTLLLYAVRARPSAQFRNIYSSRAKGFLLVTDLR